MYRNIILESNQECAKYLLISYILEFDTGLGVKVMVFNATLNNISVISWRSVLLVVETGVSGENHRPAASH